MPITIEVCVDTLSGAKLAQSLGADRLELCANLPIGGTTPSAGLLRKVRKAVEIPIHVLIRPRGGDFLYQKAEIEIMLADIGFAKSEGADAIVSGALTPQAGVDLEVTQQLIAAARPLPFTFHRAFDHSVSPLIALQQLKQIGVQRLLTSGQAASVVEGIQVLRQLMEHCADMSIMPGGGITPENIREILETVRPAEIHFSGTSNVDSVMEIQSKVKMGRAEQAQQKLETDPVRLRAMIKAVRAWEAAHI
ncbi:MAG: copper homeostasis protein CutC [Anaerolineae bacterium]|jgi:copper homeostasis protein|nr:copper homeostasis protein CutC [Anaerolineae bacterium]